jgi:uncharacterized protein
MNMKFLVPAAVAGLCITSTVSAQTSTPTPSTISVTGSATLHVKPDEVRINIGIVTQDSKANDAVAENASRLNGVLDALRQAIGPGADIKTIGYELTPDYRYDSGNRQPEITGYTATNTVRVTLDDLGKMGAVIDAATRSGANRIEDIQFTLRDPQETQTKALHQAAVDAKAQAVALAAALGLKISRVLTVRETGGYPLPIRPIPMGFARMQATARATPIEAETLDVKSRVSLTVQVDDESHAAG